MNRLSLLLSENKDDRKVHTGYFLLKVKIEDNNITIDGKKFFDQPVKKDMRKCDNIKKIETGQLNYYTTGCLLNSNYFRKHYELIPEDLSKQQILDDDLNVIQQIKFTANLDRDNGATMFFIVEEAKETVLHFSQGIIKVF